MPRRNFSTMPMLRSAFGMFPHLRCTKVAQLYNLPKVWLTICQADLWRGRTFGAAFHLFWRGDSETKSFWLKERKKLQAIDRCHLSHIWYTFEPHGIIFTHFFMLSHPSLRNSLNATVWTSEPFEIVYIFDSSTLQHIT